MMYKKLEKCPSCNNSQFKNHLICEDFTVSKESFALVKCSNCDLVFTNPYPDSISLPNYYKSDQYISHTDKSNSLINILYKIVRKYTLGRKLALISEYSKKGTILDYGCGTGDFLSTCNKAGWNTIGYEPDIKALAIAKTKSKTVFIDSLKTERKVDIISAWHVIEHVEELKSTIKQLKNILNTDGYMIIALPNLNSFDAKYYNEYWAAYDVPRHLYHFSQNSFKELISNQKLKIVDILPMKFDSYYVSLLSEKYKSDKSNIFNALLTGFKSNRLAKKNGEYSSLIYILRK